MSQELAATALSAVRDLLSQRIGLDFSDHRHRALESAVVKRMRTLRMVSVSGYARLVNTDDNEFRRLVDLVTNKLSRFCRNGEQLRAISEFIVPKLTARGGTGHCLRVWIAGCASGEEPYSVAMTLAESLGNGADFHVTATDVSRSALKIARRGWYPAGRIEDVLPDLRERYVTEEDDGFRVNDLLRGRVDFVEHSVTSGPVIRDADLVLCRNVLFYLTPEARRRAVAAILEAVCEGGYLLIGNSETLSGDRGFTGVSTQWGRVYQRPCRPPG